MWSTWINVIHMSKMIQIRNVPEPVHRELKSRAALAGMSLSDFLLKEAERVASTPPVTELLMRISSRERHHLSVSPAELIRSERDGR